MTRLADDELLGVGEGGIIDNVLCWCFIFLSFLHCLLFLSITSSIEVSFLVEAGVAGNGGGVASAEVVEQGLDVEPDDDATNDASADKKARISEDRCCRSTLLIPKDLSS